MKSKFLFFSAMIALCSNGYAQHCKPGSISASVDPQQFVINTTRGTLIDALTGLEWSICSLGQTWQNGNCLGTPVHFNTSAQALEAASNNDMGQDFRLPNIKELGSIVERSCSQPAINLSIFPGTLNAVFYSSTPDYMSDSAQFSGIHVKVIDFSDGSEFITDVNKYRYVRLVRTVP